MAFSGVVVYEGPSALNSQPILAVLTNLGRPSANAKTGDMSQLYVLCAGIHPIDAVRTGADSAICGACKHRGDMGGPDARTCYVELAQAPTSVYRAHQRGSYLPFHPSWPLSPARAWGERLWNAVSRKPIRLGAYGDPCAVPPQYIALLVAACRSTRVGASGYSHAWQSHPAAFEAQKGWLMASVDNYEEALEARRRGLRYFRIIRPGEPTHGEVQCRAARAVNPLHCAYCRGCSGNANAKGPSFYIEVHGNRAARFTGY